MEGLIAIAGSFDEHDALHGEFPDVVFRLCIQPRHVWRATVLLGVQRRRYYFVNQSFRGSQCDIF